MKCKPFIYEGKWAVITGASSGIGKAFAYELASRGANLILSSRSEATLNDIACDVRVQFGVEAEVVVFDLAASGAPERLFRKVKELNRTVQVLINNAGFASYGRLQENSVEGHGRQILLNAFSPAILAQLFLPAMVAAGDGAIINVASIAGFQPTPYMAWRFKGIHPFLFGGVMGREREHWCARPRALLWPSGHRILQSVRRRRTGCDEPQGYNRKHRKYGTPSVGSWARPCDFRKSVLLLAGAIRPVCITLGFGQDKRKDSPPVYISR
jgi:NAD(P)-dependent dehydrogenase (short-subunit alcohol dehydrogenase family)